MATSKMMMGAVQNARSSADSTALPVTQAHVRQSAETALSLAMRHATSATLVVVDAVRTALSNLDGNAQHHQHAVNHRIAMKFVETGSSLQVKDATIKTL